MKTPQLELTYFRLLDKEAKKLRRESKEEPEMNRVKKYQQMQKLASAKLAEKDQDVTISGEDTRGEKCFVIGLV